VRHTPTVKVTKSANQSASAMLWQCPSTMKNMGPAVGLPDEAKALSAQTTVKGMQIKRRQNKVIQAVIPKDLSPPPFRWRWQASPKTAMAVIPAKVENEDNVSASP